MLATASSPNKMTPEEIRHRMAELFAQQLAASPTDYLRYHASAQAIASRVNSFIEYRDFLPTSGRILDWGCHHAPDAAMVRMNAGGRSISLTGCDFMSPGSYPVFWGYSGLDFVKLEHTLKLPFDDDTFDCIIGGAALEHTAQDYESLKELYRILKTDGHLIITHLPNRFSYVEFAARNFRKTAFHRRLYSVSEFSTLLKRTGFYPLKIKRHRILPTNSLQSLTRILSRYEPAIDRIWPLNIFCGDILAVSKKVSSM
jgi:SAM-dependent methyltransferase